MFAQTIHPFITQHGRYIYRLYGGGDYEWKRLAEYVNKRADIRNISVFMINTQYGLDCLKAFKQNLSPDVHILFVEQYPIGESNFRPIIQKHLQDLRNADAIVLMGYGTEYQNLLKQLREYQVQAQILGNIDFTFDFLVKNKLAEGAIFVAPEFTVKRKGKLYELLQQKFEKQYRNKVISWDIANSFDTILLISQIYAKNKNILRNPETFFSEFQSLSSFYGASGVLQIDAKNREVVLPMVLATIRAGKITELSTESSKEF